MASAVKTRKIAVLQRLGYGEEQRRKKNLSAAKAAIAAKGLSAPTNTSSAATGRGTGISGATNPD